MPKAKINIDPTINGQYLAAKKIVRTLAAFNAKQRDRIMDIVNEATYDDSPAPEDGRQLEAFDGEGSSL